MASSVFQKYEKMATSSSKWKRLPTCEWVVCEKIHGSNFCVFFDGQSVGFGKRSGPLEESEEFQGFREHGLHESLGASVQAIFDALTETDRSLKSVAVYGELFGGGYPDREAMPNTSLIQKEILYSNLVHFMAFDIAVVVNGRRSYLDFDRSLQLCEAHNIPFIKPLNRGSFEECVHHSCEFQTTIPELFGLPPIEDNIAEGVVVRPSQEPKGTTVRFLLKNKAERFVEKHNAAGNAKGLKHAVQHEKKNLPHDDAVDLAFYEFQSRVTSTRVAAVRSKIGQINTKADKNRLLTDFVDDVYEDVQLEDESTWMTVQAFTDEQKSLLRAKVSACSKPIVQDYLEELKVANEGLRNSGGVSHLSDSKQAQEPE